jgi:hypothetical protein
MNRDHLELVTDAVCDAVKERLPTLVEEAVAGRLAAAITSAVSAAIALAIAGHADRIDAVQRLVDDKADEVQASLSAIRTEVFRSIDTTVAEKIAALPPPVAGERGPPGERGLDGRDATDDTELQAALTAIRAEIHHSVDTAVAEKIAALPPAPAGEPGAPGARGLDGKDATFSAPILWKADRVFARGSCVQHRAGLWFANVDTDAAPDAPMSGYSLMVDGCEPLEFSRDERGYLSLDFLYASGVRKSLPLRYRLPAYCGVFELETAYEPNDIVTYDGSLWVALDANTQQRPGGDSKVWKLAVKRGKDGRDGIAGAIGPAGPPGPPGPAAPTKAHKNGSASV